LGRGQGRGLTHRGMASRLSIMMFPTILLGGHFVVKAPIKFPAVLFDAVIKPDSNKYVSFIRN
jgi:hypothetical protein